MKTWLRFVASVLGTLAAALVHAQGTTYDNPVDHQTYVAPGGFQTYRPAHPKPDDGRRVVLDGVVLLTAQNDIAERMTVSDLVAYIDAVSKVAYQALDRNKASIVVFTQFECTPGRCAVKLASQGDADKDVLQRFYDGATKVSPPRLTGDVRFQVAYRVRN